MNTPLTMKNLNDHLRTLGMDASPNGGGWDTEGSIQKEVRDAARYGIAAREVIEKARSEDRFVPFARLPFEMLAELEAGIASRLAPPAPPKSEAEEVLEFIDGGGMVHRYGGGHGYGATDTLNGHYTSTATSALAAVRKAMAARAAKKAGGAL